MSVQNDDSTLTVCESILILDGIKALGKEGLIQDNEKKHIRSLMRKLNFSDKLTKIWEYLEIEP